MNTKVIYASLATGIASFFLGWLVFGIALDGYFKAHTLTHAGLMKDPPNMIALAIANLAWGFTLAWLLWKMGATSASAGLVPGAIIGLLFALAFDMYMASFMMLYSGRMVIAVDILVNAAMGAVLGGVAGAVLGMGSKTASPA